MNKKLILAMSLVILLLYFPQFMLNQAEAATDTVCNLDTLRSYPTIQAAIDANETFNGHTILVGAKTYIEHVTVNKTLTIRGENRMTTIIDGNGTGTVFQITAPKVIIANFTIKDVGTGIYLDHSNHTRVIANRIVDNTDGINVKYSYNVTIHLNTLGNNTRRGILLSNSGNFTVSNNQVYKNDWYGINTNFSSNGIIKQNNVYQNGIYDGIGILDSSNCIVTENNVTDNYFFGIALVSSNNILIYHNNIISDFLCAASTDSTVAWDNGYPSGGNYWSNYNGTDANSDGIGDTPYSISQYEIVDHYPLMDQYIVPEFSQLTIPLIFMIATLSAITIYRRRRRP